ncbi:MAG TPA: helix-turn-helix domain-containing protein [Terracidiphilus sp.]|nr:helix-turn-helix domain-containing protein [Terracidiphilus sp.]
MKDEREKIRCGNCELIQWRDRESCRRCGCALPQPVVKIVERVVERIVVRHDPQCVQNLEQARQLLAEASDRLMRAGENPSAPMFVTENFPTMAQMERAMILAAYRRSDRKPLEAARLLGIGKTTFYRKLRAIN